eukprot:12561302-Alexandrium_andersonii.AAC.1
MLRPRHCDRLAPWAMADPISECSFRPSPNRLPPAPIQAPRALWQGDLVHGFAARGPARAPVH